MPRCGFELIPMVSARFSIRIVWKWVGFHGKGYANTTDLSEFHPYIPAGQIKKRGLFGANCLATKYASLLGSCLTHNSWQAAAAAKREQLAASARVARWISERELRPAEAPAASDKMAVLRERLRARASK